MKKFIYFLIICIFSLIYSCGDDSDEKNLTSNSSASGNYDEKDFFADSLDVECRRILECVDEEKREALSKDGGLNYRSLDECLKSADDLVKTTKLNCSNFKKSVADDCLECAENVPCDILNIDYFRSCNDSCSNICK